MIGTNVRCISLDCLSIQGRNRPLYFVPVWSSTLEDYGFGIFRRPTSHEVARSCPPVGGTAAKRCPHHSETRLMACDHGLLEGGRRRGGFGRSLAQ